MKAATRQLVFHVLGHIPGAEWSGWSKGVHKRHHLATLRIGQPTGRNIYLLKLHRNRNSQDPRSKRSHAQGVLVHLAMSRVACSFLSAATLAAVFLHLGITKRERAKSAAVKQRLVACEFLRELEMDT